MGEGISTAAAGPSDLDSHTSRPQAGAPPSKVYCPVPSSVHPAPWKMDSKKSDFRVKERINNAGRR